MYQVAISDGNSKLGTIPQVNLPCISTCRPGLPCAKAGQCYALKAWQQYPATRAAWSRNLLAYSFDRADYFAQVKAYLAKRKPAYFRWHSSGDILDRAYLDGMVQVALAFPATRFRAFTKQYALVNAYLASGHTFPANLLVGFSAWPGLEMDNPHGLPVAWLYDRKNLDLRIPDGTRVCPGSCRRCKVCWLTDGDVVFHKH